MDRNIYASSHVYCRFLVQIDAFNVDDVYEPTVSIANRRAGIADYLT